MVNLLHGEALLVVATRDLEHVTLEVIAKDVALNLMRHTLVVQVTELGLIVDLDQFLAASGREGNVELHALNT